VPLHLSSWNTPCHGHEQSYLWGAKQPTRK
jgi:hypothetical protein